jgi:hypothetical protein
MEVNPMFLNIAIVPGILAGIVNIVVCLPLIRWLKNSYEPALKEEKEYQTSYVTITCLVSCLLAGVIYWLIQGRVDNPSFVFLTLAEIFATLSIASPILAQRSKPFVVWTDIFHYIVATVAGVLIPFFSQIFG